MPAVRRASVLASVYSHIGSVLRMPRDSVTLGQCSELVALGVTVGQRERSAAQLPCRFDALTLTGVHPSARPVGSVDVLARVARAFVTL